MSPIYIAEPLPGTQAGEGNRPLTSRREALRHLRDQLGITGAQAHALVRAYERDVADAVRIGNDSGRSDVAFIDWLMRQSPAQKPRATRKYQIGEAGWRTTT